MPSLDPAVMVAIALVGLSTLVLLARAFGGPSKAKFLNKERQKLTLGERVNLSHDTVRFRFLQLIADLNTQAETSASEPRKIQVIHGGFELIAAAYFTDDLLLKLSCKA